MKQVSGRFRFANEPICQQSLPILKFEVLSSVYRRSLGQKEARSFIEKRSPVQHLAKRDIGISTSIPFESISITVLHMFQRVEKNYTTIALS